MLRMGPTFQMLKTIRKNREFIVKVSDSIYTKADTVFITIKS